MATNEYDKDGGPFSEINFKLKQVDFDGNILNEMEFLKNTFTIVNINKIGPYYLISERPTVTPITNYQIRTYVIDENFNIIHDDIRELNQDVLPPNGFISTLSKGLTFDNNNVVFVPYQISDIECLLLILTYDDSGNFISLKEKVILTPVLQLRQPFLSLDKNYIILPGNKFYKFNKNFDLVETIDYATTKIPVYAHLSVCISPSDSNYIVGAVGLNDGSLSGRPFISKVDSNLIQIPNSIKNLNFYISNSKMKSEYYEYISPEESFKREEDGTYTYMTSYSFNLSGAPLPPQIKGDTLTGYIIIARFDKDLNVLCQNIFSVPNYKINIHRGTYLGSGEYLIAGNMDTIERSDKNFHKIFHPFFGKVKTDCNIPWASSTLKTIKPLINQVQMEISLFPNPTHEIIRASFETKYSNLKMTIFDNSGRLIYSGIANELLNGMNVKKWDSGPYTIQFEGKIIGRFFKIN